VNASFAPLPVQRLDYQTAEPVGVDDLVELAAQLYRDDDPLRIGASADPVRVERLSADEFVLSLALPLADRDDIDLARRGDELVVTVGAHRRVIALPSVLCRCLVEGAAYREGQLRVRFAPDPQSWPSGGRA
jgi:arsenite-transporting ATPase